MQCRTLETFTSYLGSDEFKDNNQGLLQVGLHKGDSAFVPFGCLPIVMGIGAENAEASAGYEHVAYVCSYVLEPGVTKGHAANVQTEVDAWVRKGLARGTKALDEKSVKALKAYLAAASDP